MYIWIPVHVNFDYLILVIIYFICNIYPDELSVKLRSAPAPNRGAWMLPSAKRRLSRPRTTSRQFISGPLSATLSLHAQ